MGELTAGRRAMPSSFCCGRLAGHQRHLHVPRRACCGKVPVSLIQPAEQGLLACAGAQEESFNFLERQMEWMGVCTVGPHRATLLHLAIRANLVPDRRLENGRS